MIALILEESCTGCNTCVTVCPTLVLAETARVPDIADLDACQTCYMCELHCPENAIYVGPDQFAVEAIDPAAAIASGQLGKVRRDHGWNQSDMPGHLDEYRLLGPLLNLGGEIAARRYAERQLRQDVRHAEQSEDAQRP